MVKLNFSLIAKLVLKKDAIKEHERGLEINFVNPLPKPKIEISNFRIASIAEHADIWIGGIKLEESHFHNLLLDWGGELLKLEDFEQMDKIHIPHKEKIKGYFDLPFQAGDEVEFHLIVKGNHQIEIKLKRKVQKQD